MVPTRQLSRHPCKLFLFPCLEDPSTWVFLQTLPSLPPFCHCFFPAVGRHPEALILMGPGYLWKAQDYWKANVGLDDRPQSPWEGFQTLR